MDFKIQSIKVKQFNKKVYNCDMKIWMSDTQTPTHRLVRLNCAEHSDYKYIGEANDEELREFLLDIQDDMDVDKNIHLLKYYGYLHLFIIAKNRFLKR